jgi:putative tryptophan/tyrosine transport system substrate-binding protein
LQIRRREFIAGLGGAAAWPLAARAQQGGRMRRIRVLSVFSEDDPVIQDNYAALRQELEKRGWQEGRNLHIDYRLGVAQDQVSVRAKELIGLQPDVIFSQILVTTAALQRESRATPIVSLFGADPVELGLVASLSRPGGNITGVMGYDAEIAGKWIQMLKEIAPRISRVAFMTSPRENFGNTNYLSAAKAMASSLGIEFEFTPVADSEAEIRRVIAAFAGVTDGGLVVPPGFTTFKHRDLIIALAAGHRLPTVYNDSNWVKAGGLMSYGIDWRDMYRQAAAYIDRILRGDKPADLPVQAPVKYQTVLNLKTARALGVDVPPGLVAADEVIE